MSGLSFFIYGKGASSDIPYRDLWGGLYDGTHHAPRESRFLLTGILGIGLLLWGAALLWRRRHGTGRWSAQSGPAG
ncbi:MAG TPA: hypothetical protein P5327_13680 [Kiritimatiellia bacterium]|nr:hypothetical protein [Kiritimatiellia bacterium]